MSTSVTRESRSDVTLVEVDLWSDPSDGEDRYLRGPVFLF